jgi:RHS repeat-associated protein
VPRLRCLDWMNAVSGPTDPFLGTCSRAELVHKDDATHYMIGRPVQAWAWEVLNDGTDALWDVVDAARGAMSAIPIWDLNTVGAPLALVSHSLTYYDGNAFTGLPLGQLGTRGVAVRSLNLVHTPEVLLAAYGADVPECLTIAAGGFTWDPEYPAAFAATVPSHAGYVPLAALGQDCLYVPTMQAKYDFQTSAPLPRGLALESRDPLGNVSSVGYDDYDFLPVVTTDALGMTVQAAYDYRLLQPYLITDPNGNRSAVRFSPLGFVTEAGVMGKLNEAVGDWISEGTNGPVFQASSVMDYNLHNWLDHGLPAYVKTTQHEWHINDLDYTTDTIVQKAFSDGFGRVIQTRAQAEEVIFGDQDFGDSGLPASQTVANAPAVGVLNTSTSAPNVIVNGFQTTNNKGMVVEQWEPFYATGWDYQAASHLTQPLALPSYYGQKVVMYYDSIGRAVRTLNPDGTEQRVVTGKPLNPDLSPAPFRPTPWESYTYDANDLADITHPSGGHNVPTGHFLTPRSVKIDALGRMIESTDRNYNGGLEEVVMRYFYDIRGNKLRVDDAIKVANPSAGRDSAFLHVYDLANQPLKTTHIDGGVKTMVINAAGLPVEARDAKGALVLSAFDDLLRPVSMWARDNGSEDVTLRSKVVYGEAHSSPVAGNWMGRPWKNYDEAGLVEILEYDFKGQPKKKTRKVISDAVILTPMPTSVYRVDWDLLDENTDLEGEYQTDMAYDGLGRPTTITLPMDVSGGRKEVVPTYNRSGAMQSISLDNDIYVARIAYNAKGQKVLVAYGNGLMTRFAYDVINFRLLRQKTEGFSLSSLSYTPSSGSTKYDCAYTYDLSGNIVHITDATPNCGVGGSGGATPDELIRDFEYDALYRLLRATGRESGSHVTSSDPYHEPALDNSANGTVAYYRTYKYDKLGNMLDLYHNAGTGNTFHRYFNDWNNVGSAAFGLSNLATEINYGGTTVNYTFDDNGNMLTEGGSRSFEWDYGDRMRGFSEGTSVQAAYLYDGGGNRVKKIVVDGSGNSVVTVYIDGGFEHLYKLSSAAVVSEAHNELHVMDGRSRIAVKRIGSAFSGDASPSVRYNLEDHLGNSSVSVDSSGSLITREEYFPFGETSFGSFARKRYRFCGKERDEESGLYYYGARYYAPWCCRFVSVDPLAGEMPFATPYSYAVNSPMVFVDVDGLAPGRTDQGQPEKQKRSGGGNVAPQQPGPDPNSALSPLAGEYHFTAPKVDSMEVGYQPIDLELARDAREIKALQGDSKITTDYDFSNLPTIGVMAEQATGGKVVEIGGKVIEEVVTDGVVKYSRFFGLKVAGGTIGFMLSPIETSSNDMVNPYQKAEFEKQRLAREKADEYEKNPKKYGTEDYYVYRLRALADGEFPCRLCYGTATVSIHEGETVKFGITSKLSIEERYKSPPSYFPELLDVVRPTFYGPFPKHIAMAIEKRVLTFYGTTQESWNIAERNGMPFPLMRPCLNYMYR